MLRAIGAIVAGYVTVAVFIFVTFTGAYLALGADRAFQPGVYQISATWAALSLGLGFAGAALGGYVCRLIARSMRPALALCAVVLALGLAQAAFTAGAGGARAEPEARSGDVSNLEAMRHARTPLWVVLVNPLLGAGGIYLGARVRERRG